MKKTLTKADIVERIYESTDKNRVDVKNVVEKLLEIMKNAIKKDNALLISGFGKFEAYDKASRKGRQVQSRAQFLRSRGIRDDPTYQSPRFLPGWPS